jgi:CelD/BcsL family acetyltransferase involved in cellulose biosynthesis
VLTHEKRLVGVAPFFTNRADPRTLRLVGTGNTDYLDIVIEERAAHESTEAIFAELCRTRSWDEIEFENLRRSSPLLAANTSPDFFAEIEQQDVCPVVLLPDSVDQFLNGLPHQLIHNLSYYRRKLAALGEVKIERADEKNFAELFEAFVRLHEARWRMNNQPGMLCDDNVQNFLREAAGDLLRSGALRLYALHLDHRIIASLYGLHHAGRTHYYLGGFDPEFKQCSPGTLLVAHALSEAIRERARVFDFLRGREEYKYKWGARDEAIYRKHLRQKTRSVIFH